jgi:hypothetical protein
MDFQSEHELIKFELIFSSSVFLSALSIVQLMSACCFKRCLNVNAVSCLVSRIINSFACSSMAFFHTVFES